MYANETRLEYNEHTGELSLVTIENGTVTKREEKSLSFLIEKIEGGEEAINKYIASAERKSESRKWGKQNFFIFPDGFRISAGHYNNFGDEGVIHYIDEACPFDFGRDIPQSKDFLKESLSKTDYIEILSHLSSEKVKIKRP
ncbi:MAG: hypothetical protein ACOCT9_03290 [archaeon]